MVRKETVTRVIDGDTFLTASRKRSVRLANASAPEKKEKGGALATKKLKAMIEGKKVSVETVARDKWGRAIAEVKVGRKSVNKSIKGRVQNPKKPRKKKK